jgi:hypothetical protein
MCTSIFLVSFRDSGDSPLFSQSGSHKESGSELLQIVFFRLQEIPKGCQFLDSGIHGLDTQKKFFSLVQFHKVPELPKGVGRLGGLKTEPATGKDRPPDSRGFADANCILKGCRRRRIGYEGGKTHHGKN